MQIYKDFDEIGFCRESVLTVGTFDGVHKGHKLLLSRLKDIAQKDNLKPVVITIDPHPQIVLQTQDRQKIHLLSTIKERIELFERAGVEHLLIIPFSYEFSQTDPEVFVKEYLYGKVGFSKILVGYDHLFGKNREGNEELLQRLSRELEFSIEKIEAFAENEIIISSTKIRKLLEEGKIEIANELLGYPYLVRGKVVHGNGRGSSIGYPTANIRPPDIYKLLPGKGVYLISTVFEGNKYYGMANIGYRPTLTNDIKPTLEVNIFDFDEDIYERTLTISFHKYIRDEIKFRHTEDLIHQIEKDEMICKDFIESF